MYRKGLTVKRIAMLCGAVPQTVSRHIRVQREKCPDMVAEHMANRPSDKPRPPGSGWQANVAALTAYRQAYGTYLTTGDPDPANRKLAQWLPLQRRAQRAGTLPEDRIRMLSALPDWANNQRTMLEAARWHSRFEELRIFRSEAGRWPRFRDPVEEAEHALGVWLHGQRQNFGAGQLTDDEVQLLDSAVPGWNAWRLKHLYKLASQGAAFAQRVMVRVPLLVLGAPSGWPAPRPACRFHASRTLIWTLHL